MLRKSVAYISDRLPLLVGIGIIVAGHWGWMKLQDNPYLVSDSERKELPIFTAMKAIKRKIIPKSDIEQDRKSS